jgi:uncharacterized phiE125 gp8 family phage protein
MTEPRAAASSFVRPPWTQPAAVASVLVDGPAEEPLTIAEGKLRAGLDWPDGDPRDDLMASFIAAARNKVEQDTGLALLTQTRDVTWYWEPEAAPLQLPLPWQAAPVQSMTDPQGRVITATVIAGTLVLEWSTPPVAGTYRIVAGWPSVDALKAEAPLLYHAVGLLTAHFATLGRDLASTDAATLVPYGYEEAIAPHRLIWLT